MDTIKRLDEQPLNEKLVVHKSWAQQHCISAVQGKVTIITKEFTEVGEVDIHNPITVNNRKELIDEIVRAYPSDKYEMDLEIATDLVDEILEGSTTEGTFEKFVEVCNEN